MMEYKLEELCRGELPLVVQKLKMPNYQWIHKHNAVEIVYIEHGSGWCAVNGIIHPMLTGDLYIIPIGATHEYYGEQDLNYINILFDGRIFQEREQELYRAVSGRATDKTPDKYTFGPDLQSEIIRRINELDEELQSGEPFHSLRTGLLLTDLLIFIFRNAVHSPGIKASHAQKHLGRIMTYITDNLGAKLTLEHLAEISGYTTAYFGKLFRREIGTGISEYIFSKRMESSCHQLLHTRKTVGEIAAENGFFDTSYFIKRFKRYCGFTPLQFRRRWERD